MFARRRRLRPRHGSGHLARRGRRIFDPAAPADRSEPARPARGAFDCLDSVIHPVARNIRDLQGRTDRGRGVLSDLSRRDGRGDVGRPQDRRGRPRLSPVWTGDDPPYSAAGGSAVLCDRAALRPRTWLDVRHCRRVHGRIRGPGLSADRRPAARQADRDRRRDSRFRGARQDHRLDDRRHGGAVSALGRPRARRGGLAMLLLDQVGKTYPNGVHALDRFSAEIRLGEIVAIIGGSGCGKSTLLRAVAGLDPATSGAVVLDEIAITAPHEKIGIIFQEPRLLPWLSVADNIGFGLSDAPANIRREKVARALQRVGLTDKADAWPRELSGGQAQRVAIARALVPQPEVLLLDEPFSALDAFPRRDLQDHLLDLWADTRPTLVLVTHDVDEAVVLADRVLVMRPRPGRLFAEIVINLARPRDRQSPLFDNFKHRVLTALDRSLDRSVPDADAKSTAGEAMWW